MHRPVRGADLRSQRGWHIRCPGDSSGGRGLRDGGLRLVRGARRKRRLSGNREVVQPGVAARGPPVGGVSFAGPDIRRGGVDGPYLATLSIAPGARGIDPTTTYTTLAYHATDFDATATVPAQP